MRIKHLLIAALIAVAVAVQFADVTPVSAKRGNGGQTTTQGANWE